MAMAPTRIPLAFGEGLDRYTGVKLVEPTTFEDLRNVHLLNGKIEGRQGNSIVQTLTGDTVVLVHPIRGQAVGCICIYDEATGDVKLYIVPPDLSSATLVGTVFTIPAGAGYPKLIAADSYGLLFIAHDEADYSSRQPTKVFDPVANTITALNLNLGGGAQDVAFRGVCRHLQFMVGWGYGNLTDPDRPELVRVSMPGDPATFRPEHYFLAGQRDEPVTVCVPASKVLLAMKESMTYDITGHGRRTFAIDPGDELYGCPAGRLAISVGGVAYFWSLEGPRASVGGLSSRDLALPLYLRGPTPSDLWDESLLSYGFAIYRSHRKEVEWIFDQWGYALNLADPGRPRWSYREYGVRLYSGGILYQGVSVASTLVPEAFPTNVSAVLTDPPDKECLVSWDNDTSVGPLTAADTAEIYCRDVTKSTWTQVASGIALSGANDSATVTLPSLATEYEIAVRFVRNGVPASAYSSGNCSNWPSTARFSSVTTQLTVVAVLQNPRWVRNSATEEVIIVEHSGVNQKGVDVYLEKNVGAGWVAVSNQSSFSAFGTPTITYVIQGGEGETEIQLRARYQNALRTAPNGGAISVYCGPFDAPSAVNIGYDIDFHYPVSFTRSSQAIAAGWQTEIWAHNDADPYALAGTGTDSPIPIVLSCPATTVFAKARHKATSFGVDDYSLFSGEDSTAADCDGLP